MFLVDRQDLLKSEGCYTVLNCLGHYNHSILHAPVAPVQWETKAFSAHTYLRLTQQLAEIFCQQFAERWTSLLIVIIEMTKALLRCAVNRAKLVTLMALVIARLRGIKPKQKALPQACGTRTNIMIPSVSVVGGAGRILKPVCEEEDLMDLTADFLAIFRPTLYALALWQSKRKASQKPFLFSLGLDLAICAASFALAREQPKSVPSPRLIAQQSGLTLLREPPMEKLKRRYFALFYYLFRSPFFDVALRGRLQAAGDRVAGVPVFGILVASLLEYYLRMQRYYFFTSNS
eukprot:TRINITY_DN3723_c0_g1_i1.p1 TRINITY_DN3723_c0_g1~~TRINITY_DN3723_c0_g1_i1.p1  ORF type:complete len:290 (-),score=44.11 TRINITY_DN3723_c0_g1_i1:46-915(-)